MGEGARGSARLAERARDGEQHAGGAELKVPVERQVPSEFLLYVPIDEIAYQCSLRWRRGERVGVSFLGTAPKPKLHYG